MTESPVSRHRRALLRALGLAAVSGLAGWFICLSIIVWLRFSPQYPRTTTAMLRAMDSGPTQSLLLMIGRIQTFGLVLRAIGLAAFGLLVATQLVSAANRYRLVTTNPPV